MGGATIFPVGADAVIARLYPDIPAIRAAIPGFSDEQIRRRAWKTGAAANARPPNFTPEEDAVLIRLYPDIAAIRAELPGRDKAQIERRAWRIKATRSLGPFQPHEDAILRRLFPDIDAIHAELPNRPARAIAQRASRLKLTEHVGKHRRWPVREMRLLRLFYPDYGILCAVLAPRTRDAIKWRASATGLSAGAHGGQRGPTRRWTPDELEAAKAYGAVIPGRTLAAINRARSRNKITADSDPRSAKRREKEVARSIESARRKVERHAAAVARAAEVAERRRVRRMEAKRAARAAASLEKARRAAERARIADEARATAPVRWTGPDLNPHVIAMAGRSRFGLGLVSDVQRAVPRDLWPHVKPRVIEDLVLSVVEGRFSPADLPSMLPGAIKAVMRGQFEAGR